MTVPFLYKLKTNTNDHDIIDANVFSFKLMRFPSRKRKTGPYYTINVHEILLWESDETFFGKQKKGREKIA